MKLSLRNIALASTLGTAGVLACSATDRGFATTDTIFAGDDAATDAPAACEERKCSRDLHAVLDACTEAVIESCGPSSGCANGACVPACDSAALAQGSIGCSFWTTPPDVVPEADNSCFAAFVANTWTTPVNVKGTYGKQALDLSRSVYRAVATDGAVRYERIEGAIPPGELGIIFLSQAPDRPETKGSSVACPDDVEVAHVGVAVAAHAPSVYEAFHLETDAPVSVYSMFPYGGAKSYMPSATLVLPSSSWATSYVLLDGWSSRVSDSFIQIVAGSDDTEVRVRPVADVRPGPDVAGAARGSVATWRLQRGQVLELVQRASLAGSIMESSAPVAVFGGTVCPYIPEGVTACDSLHQQVAPVNQWAARYSAVPYASRRVAAGDLSVAESVPWRIVAAQDGTALTYDPARPEGAPTVLAAGEAVTFTTEAFFSVRSQDAAHPIHVSTYMTGARRSGTLGDPDYVTLVPDEQFLDRYVFFVDHTYSDSTLTVVRRKDQLGFHDVEVDCLGAIGDWRPLGTDGTSEYTWVRLTKDKRGVGGCGYGRHEASSDGPFGLYVWGVDSFASYGFPAGAGSRPTSTVELTVR